MGSSSTPHAAAGRLLYLLLGTVSAVAWVGVARRILVDLVQRAKAGGGVDEGERARIRIKRSKDEGEVYGARPEQNNLATCEKNMHARESQTVSFGTSWLATENLGIQAIESWAAQV